MTPSVTPVNVSQCRHSYIKQRTSSYSKPQKQSSAVVQCLVAYLMKTVTKLSMAEGKHTCEKN